METVNHPGPVMSLLDSNVPMFLLKDLGILEQCKLGFLKAPNLSFPGGSDGKKSACNAGDQTQSLGWEDSLEKEMATHSSILAWTIPWTEEPGWLQSMESQESDMTEQLTLVIVLLTKADSVLGSLNILG